jgi:putative membrane protein
MTTEQDEEKPAAPGAADPTELAVIRTSLALDRTMLAWMRTSLALIGFGFTLARFVHDLIEKGQLTGVHQYYPRQLGFTLMGLGIATLMGGAFEHIRMSRKLMKTGGATTWPASLIFACVLLLVAVLLTISLLRELRII